MISFTKDKFQNAFLKTWSVDHPRMWAQYGVDNSGACLIFDELKLREENPELKDKSIFRIEDVKYKFWTITNDVEDSNDFSEIIWRKYRSIFFTKSIDWKDECERRIFQFGEQEFLNIKNSLVYVCLGYRFSKYTELIKILVDSSFGESRFLSPRNFIFQSNNHGRIQTHPADCKIINEIIKNKEYLDFLNKNGYSLKK
jgi:hypothetical protein